MSNVDWGKKAVLAWELELKATLVADADVGEHVARVAIAPTVVTAVEGACAGGALDAEPTPSHQATLPPRTLVVPLPRGQDTTTPWSHHHPDARTQHPLAPPLPRGHSTTPPTRAQRIPGRVVVPGCSVGAEQCLLLIEDGGGGLTKLGQHNDDVQLELR